LRRTRIRRARGDIASAGSQLAAEALDMLSDPAVYPNPGAQCSVCEFAAPCLAMFDGADPGPILTAQFGQRLVPEPKPRLGQASWGFGRGAAPPRWNQP
jgi:hypothetical protein